MKELKNLQELFCETNLIRSLKGLQELKNLKDLDCWNNKISYLEIELFQEKQPNKPKIFVF